MATKGSRMELTVSKWGNSLALRLPAESAKRIGVGEGDTLIAEVSADGRLVLTAEGGAIGKAEFYSAHTLEATAGYGSEPCSQPQISRSEQVKLCFLQR